MPGMDEGEEGKPEKVESDHKDSIRKKSVGLKACFKDLKWRRRWITNPLGLLVGCIYLYIIFTQLYLWVRNKQFDLQQDLKIVRITAVKGQRLYDITRFEVKVGQPVKLEFENPDAMPHNIVIVKPGAEENVGLAATRMVTDPEQVKIGQYIPESDAVLFHTKMTLPNSSETLRFTAPKEPGNYPYICTFPVHWMVMKGMMIVN
tara:strand:+ start:74 stop:685 length:612 start_codon:yes stop_codon:yes gene_type:complete